MYFNAMNVYTLGIKLCNIHRGHRMHKHEFVKSINENFCYENHQYNIISDDADPREERER